MLFFRKLRAIFYKENRKKFSILRTIIKAIFSLFIIVLLPILFFIIFISIEPREIIDINDYIIKKIKQNEKVKKISFSSAKITIDKHFRIVYIINNLDFALEDLRLKLPQASFKIDILNIIKRRVFFNEININNLIGYLDYEEKNDKETMSYLEAKQYIYKILDKLYNNTIIFNNLSLNNSNFYFKNIKTNDLDKLEIVGSIIKLERLGSELKLNLRITSKMNNEKSIFSTNKCFINNKKEVSCNSIFYNLYTSNLFKIISKDILKYSEYVDGLFNLEVNTYFENYTDITDSNFKIDSKGGSFYIKEFFKNKIYFKNLLINGKSKDEDTINITNIKVQLSDNKKDYMDFLMSLDFKNNDFLKLSINLEDGYFSDLDTFWPLFFDDKEIRKWTVDSFKSGNINKAFVDIDLLYKNNSFNLNNLKAEVDFNNTLLDYSNNFPEIQNMTGKAIFSKDDLLINVNSAKTLDTDIKDSDIYINFNNPTVNIKINSNGDSGDLLSFIDKKYKNNNFINGIAESKIIIDIPIKTDLKLNDIYLKAESDIKNINSNLFSRNSNINLKLFKNYNLNNFNIKLNMDKTYIKNKTINFLKNKNDKLNIDFNVIIKENNDVFVKNLNAYGDYINFNGNIYIDKNGLSLLELYNIKYDDNSFNIRFYDNKISLYGNKLNITYLKNNKKNNKINYNVDFKVDSLILNGEYYFNFVNFIYDKDKMFLSIDNNNFINATKNEDKYIINGEIKDIGSFLNYSNINKNIISGYTIFSGDYYDNSLNLTIKIKDDFDIITTTAKDSNIFRKLLESEFVSDKTKDKLRNDNSLSFSEAVAEIVFYDNNILKLKSFALKSKGFFGVGIGGKGKIFIDTGEISINGAIIPADKLNTLFGLNKVPVINSIIFGGKNGGLFTTGYDFYKKSYKDNYTFKLTPISTSSVNSIKNAFLLLLLL